LQQEDFWNFPAVIPHPMENVIITGTGCIAAAYLGRVNSSPSSFPATCPAASSRPRRRWKNLPGFPNGIRGHELTMNMQT